MRIEILDIQLQKFYLMNLNVLCPKVGFFRTIKRKTQQVKVTTDY